MIVIEEREFLQEQLDLRVGVFILRKDLVSDLEGLDLEGLDLEDQEISLGLGDQADQVVQEVLVDLELLYLAVLDHLVLLVSKVLSALVVHEVQEVLLVQVDLVDLEAQDSALLTAQFQDTPTEVSATAEFTQDSKELESPQETKTS